MSEGVTARLRRAFLHVLGEDLSALLADEALTELSVNPDGSVWTDRLGEGSRRQPIEISAEHAEAVLAHAAGQTQQALHDERPVFEGRLPSLGYRVAGAIAPVSPAGPLFSIRKPPTKLWDLEAYFESPPGAPGQGAQAPPAAGYAATLEWALQARRNVVLAGGTSSAKTSLLAAVFQRIAELELEGRFVALEEVDPELIIAPQLNVARLLTAPEAKPPVDLARLVRLALRLNPDRIVVGETRGGEAVPLLRSWATGHDGGLTTVHASSAADTLYRLEDLLLEGGVPNPRPLVARTVHLVVYLRYFHPGRRLVTELVAVEGLDDNDDYRLRTVEP